ncbi:hypothetical protein [Alishewanella sp. SMS8]|uniref:hypothetical protein n=1 Tax=Alishewanella sp. SMS8 TaxID=2994676 RepID=UPI002740A636|nr:hypothetical protein [Alishewanella sp. SMS8]MDP4945558.1 hypothetical protein [Alishewanella sp.]MDP5035440.1 hypothetical protein [Alishewanella sp.]MDP5459387.1 hypothetical protein [Alishewanella sp. SMS8]
MQGNNPKDQHDAKVSRRKFLTRTGAGLVIASIPGKSVWARTSGVTGSIAVSSNGSDMGDTVNFALRSPGYFKNSAKNYNSSKFRDIFGGNPVSPSTKKTTIWTLQDVLNNPGESSKKGLGGPSNVNYFLVCIYLNACYCYNSRSTAHGISFPVVGFDKQFKTLQSFASYLYQQALMNPSGTGMALSKMVDDYHV